MVVISKTFSIPQFYDSHAIAPLKDLVFLDIETTGLTPATSSIYLIGAVYHQQMEWHIRQWFSDSLNSEQEILEDFFSFIKNYQVIVSFKKEKKSSRISCSELSESENHCLICHSIC